MDWIDEAFRNEKLLRLCKNYGFIAKRYCERCDRVVTVVGTTCIECDRAV